MYIYVCPEKSMKITINDVSLTFLIGDKYKITDLIHTIQPINFLYQCEKFEHKMLS